MGRYKSDEERAYSSIVTFLGGLSDFHPDLFANLGPDELHVLRLYYWLGRQIDVEDIFAYRQKLLASDPDLGKQAEVILRKQFARIGVANDPADYAAWGAYEQQA